jgi:adenosylcobinamide-phosphate synthase
MITPLELAAAFALDVLFGDPAWFPHPVRGIGWLINTFETWTRKRIRNERAAGVVTVLLTLAVTGAVVAATCLLARRAHPWAGHAVTVGWLYLGLSTRSLSDHVRRIMRDLTLPTPDAARRSVGHIVGRDTARLDAGGISRAAIESVAESTVDGILSPLFFAVLGGPVLLWLFKAASTCDSMIGHMDARYIRFGTFGARLDDVLNYLPARLAFFLFPAAAGLTGQNAAAAWRIARRDHGNHASPNAGVPEAAMAGALGVRLGGPTTYEGEVVDKPPFGAEFRPPQPDDISAALRLMWVVALLGLALGMLVSRVVLQ